jgi:membrane-associated phospholipid phosphatase
MLRSPFFQPSRCSIRRLRAWAWVLTVLICISAITTGWHYGVDVLGGIILAIVSVIA